VSRKGAVYGARTREVVGFIIIVIISLFAELYNSMHICIDFRRAGQQGPTRTLTAALKRSVKQLLGTYSITKVHITNEKTREINFFNAVPKTFKGAKFTVVGSAFQTLITLSTKMIIIITDIFKVAKTVQTIAWTTVLEGR